MFVVASVFKNESGLLAEWIEHYLKEGAVHFFLVDHGSTDAPERVLEKYSAAVTLFRDSTPFFPGIQTVLLNRHILPKVYNGLCWVVVCDVDEYLYAPRGSVARVLDQTPKHVNKMWTPWKIFGSNGHRSQPRSVVAGFTRRADGVSLPYRRVGNAFESHLGVGKTVARRVLRLGVHECTSSGNDVLYAWDARQTPARLLDRLPKDPVLALNHYMFMSREYYESVKCVRGGGQTGTLNPKYTMAFFDQNDSNELEDLELLNKTYA